MKLVVQRVSQASVQVGETRIAHIGRGILILCGIEKGDRDADAEWLAGKCARLRIFEDDDGKMNRDIASVSGSFLVVSQFTLSGDCSKGNRPSFIDAADPAEGERLYQHFVQALRKEGADVETGRFRAMMQVSLVNDGPVTLLLESRGRIET